MLFGKKYAGHEQDYIKIFYRLFQACRSDYINETLSGLVNFRLRTFIAINPKASGACGRSPPRTGGFRGAQYSLGMLSTKSIISEKLKIATKKKTYEHISFRTLRIIWDKFF